MAQITRLGAYGGPRPLSEVAVTRLGLYGGPRPLYGSFEGKPPGAVAGAVMNQLQSSNVGADLYNGTLQ